jgi:hypothetical protein
MGPCLPGDVVGVAHQSGAVDRRHRGPAGVGKDGHIDLTLELDYT